MNTLIIFIGVILGTIGCLMLFFMNYKDETPNPKSVSHLAIALFCVVVGWTLFGAARKHVEAKPQCKAQYLIFVMPDSIPPIHFSLPNHDSITGLHIEGVRYELNGNVLTRIE